MNYEKFIASYPNLDRHLGTGGNCHAWHLPVGAGYVLITSTVDAVAPSPTDTHVNVGTYDANDECDNVETLTWDELEELLDAMMNLPRGWNDEK